MSKECTHTPKCIFNCRVCGKHIPESIKIEPGGKNDFEVHFEKGIRSIVHQVHTEQDAINVAQISSARAAGLCIDHIVRPIGVFKIDPRAICGDPMGYLQ